MKNWQQFAALERVWTALRKRPEYRNISSNHAICICLSEQYDEVALEISGTRLTCLGGRIFFLWEDGRIGEGMSFNEAVQALALYGSVDDRTNVEAVQ